jgi:subtilisin family serine protease
MTRTLRRFVLGFVMLAAVFGAPERTVNAAGQRAVQHRGRLDTRLQAVLDETAPKPQRVIIRVRPGSRVALRDSLTAHGDQILAELDSLDALTALVHGEDLGDLADKEFVLSVSTDAIVRPHLLGIIGGLVKVVVGLVQVVGNLLLPNGADTEGPTVPPAVLRQTLGVGSSSWTGKGIGVAVIDSGLEAPYGSDFSGRVTAFYDFTKGGIVSSSPYDDNGHGTHVAGTIGGSGARSSDRDFRGLAPNVKFVILKVLDKNGAGYTSDVIRAVDFAVANRVARTSDIRACVERPARPGRRARGARRRGRRRSGRQLRQEPDHGCARLWRRHISRQCTLGDHGRCGQNPGHRETQRRPHRRLQLIGPHVVRRIRQTRRGCAGP